MSTTVKLGEGDKKRLERLQALVTVKSGKKLTQQKLLGLLIGRALERGDEFVEVASGPKLPLTDAEFERIRSHASDWGVKTRSEEVDEILYGKRSRK